MKNEKNNKLYFSGEIVSEPALTHTCYDEGFYEFNVRIPRLSGTDDVIPVTCPERLLVCSKLSKGQTINAVGELRTHNKLENERSRLILTAFVQELLPTESETYPNRIELTGYVCKPPQYRTTPLNREIADLLIAVNRGNRKTDYIPCIVWGRNARFASMLLVGEFISLTGRLQSREYQKKISETETETKTAYEVSVSTIAAEGRDVSR